MIRPTSMVWAIILISTLWAGNLIAGDQKSEFFIFVLKVEGGKVYRIPSPAGQNEIKDMKKELRRMEKISTGTVLEIEKAASVYLTCPGCNVVKLTNQESPYTVQGGDFKQMRSIRGDIATALWHALEYFVYPESKPRQKIETGVRIQTGRFTWCQSLQPPHKEIIVPFGESIIFQWDLKDGDYYFAVMPFSSKEILFSQRTSLNRIGIQVENFEPGEKYEWTLKNGKTGEECYSNFYLLPQDEAAKIMNTINGFISVLPDETDDETRWRLQCGYLFSRGFEYDAWRCLNLNRAIK